MTRTTAAFRCWPKYAEDVRIESATKMLKHGASFQEIKKVNSWFGDRYPQEANALLH